MFFYKDAVKKKKIQMLQNVHFIDLLLNFQEQLIRSYVYQDTTVQKEKNQYPVQSQPTLMYMGLSGNQKIVKIVRRDIFVI